MIRTVIIPSMTGELEVIPGPAAAAADDPVRRLVAAWLLGYQSPATRRAYAADMTAWLAFCDRLGTGPLQARRVHADAWARAQQAAGAAPRTAARRLAAVSSWYQYLDGENIRAGSPLEHARRPPVPDRGETPGLTRGELRRLLAAAREHGSPRSIALLELLAHTGLRIGEALSRDVRHLAHDRGHRILRLDRKGGRGDRTILTAPVTRALEDYLDGRADGPLFTTRTGQRMGQPEAWKMTRRLAARAGLETAAQISPHSLRVAFITGAREAGVPLEDVQDAAGHADPRTTRRYDRGRHSLDRHAAYALTAWLAEPD
jgi:integrase/recombinase XerD